MGTLDRCTAEMNEFENGPGALVPGPGMHALTTSSAEPLGQGRVLQNLTYTARQIISGIELPSRTISGMTPTGVVIVGTSHAMASAVKCGPPLLQEHKAMILACR